MCWELTLINFIMSIIKINIVKEQDNVRTNINNKLIFVYNANSGAMNAAFDSMHKIFSPKTYECNLCKLTYGPLTEKKEWKEFLKTIETPIEFLHKDEFKKRYNKTDTKLPVILKEKENKELTILVNADEINETKTIDELKELIRKKIKKNSKKEASMQEAKK